MELDEAIKIRTNLRVILREKIIALVGHCYSKSGITSGGQRLGWDAAIKKAAEIVSDDLDEYIY